MPRSSRTPPHDAVDGALLLVVPAYEAVRATRPAPQPCRAGGRPGGGIVLGAAYNLSGVPRPPSQRHPRPPAGGDRRAHDRGCPEVRAERLGAVAPGARG